MSTTSVLTDYLLYLQILFHILLIKIVFSFPLFLSFFNCSILFSSLDISYYVFFISNILIMEKLNTDNCNPNDLERWHQDYKCYFQTYIHKFSLSLLSFVLPCNGFICTSQEVIVRWIMAIILNTRIWSKIVETCSPPSTY